MGSRDNKPTRSDIESDMMLVHMLFASLPPAPRNTLLIDGHRHKSAHLRTLQTTHRLRSRSSSSSHPATRLTSHSLRPSPPISRSVGPLAPHASTSPAFSAALKNDSRAYLPVCNPATTCA